MMMIRKVMIGTVLAGVFAAPLMAMTLAIDADLGLSVDKTTMLEDKSATAKANTDAMESGDVVTPMDDSKFVGNVVKTSDQKVIGLVQKVGMMEDGRQKIWIALNSDVGSKATFKAFTVFVKKDVVADGALTLGYTEAELFKELGLQVEDDS